MMSIETKTTSFITSAPTMATKSPAAAVTVATSSSSSTTQSHSSPVTASNNNTISAAATSIITAPLMSQSPPVNPTQKQTANVSVTIPGKPSPPTSSIPPGPLVGAPTTSTTNTISTTVTVTAPKPNPTPVVSSTVSSVITAVSSGGATVSTVAEQVKTTGSVTTTAPSVSTSSSATATSSVLSSPSAKPPEAKPTMMNGGSTIVLKQPPPPVTILPPTPAATPPPVHRQTPTLPQPQNTTTNTPTTTAPVSKSSGSVGMPVAVPTTTTTTSPAANQKSQPANPPPPSSASNVSDVKQQSPSTANLQQKSQNQEKPTQPLTSQHQFSSTSSPVHKEGTQPKDQQESKSGNQERKINNVTSSVTNPAAAIAGATPVLSTRTTSSAATASSATPITGGSTSNIIKDNNFIKEIVQPISRPVPVVSTRVTAAPTQSATSSVPTSINSGDKKMETSDFLPSQDSKLAANEKEKVKMEMQSDLVNLGGAGDAKVKDIGIVSSVKLGNDVKKIEETDKNVTAVPGVNNNVSDPKDTKKDLIVNSTKVDQDVPKEKANMMSRPNTGVSGGKKEEIGEDVKRIMEAIENAGLCGPKQPESSLDTGPDSNISNSSVESGKGNRVSKIGRPSTGKPQTRPSGTISPTKGISTTSPTKPRPSTASGIPKKENGHENGLNGSPRPGVVKSPRGKAAPASGPTSLPATPTPATTLPPKSATSGLRTSTSRVASAKANTAPTSSAKAPNENKNTKASVNGADSCSSVTPVETETRASSATGNRSTPRLRPSSSLYRPTASSALKGVSSASHNNSSNQNLHSNPSTPRTSRSATGPRSSRSTITMGDSAGGSGDGKPATLREQFTAFSRFGNKEEDGKHITLSNCDKWMKQAKVIDGKKVTTTDTSICFKKLFKTAKKITFEDFKKYIEELAKNKKMEQQEILDKLANCGTPGLSTATRAAHSNVVDRLTDTSKYTGSHKERFDATGKGRGIEGRKDVPDSSGYVSAFKEKLDLKENAGEVKKEESVSPTPAN